MTSQKTLSVPRESLETAFNLFNQLSEQLCGSYQQLQQQVLELNQQLAAAHTERMSELAEKERLADRLKSLLETLPAAVIRLDADSRIKEFNPTSVRLFPTIVIDQEWAQLLARYGLCQEDDEAELKLLDGKVLSVSHTSLEQSGERILVILDVTETHKLRERLNRQQRLSAMGELSAQLAHQIRTPLSSALLYTSHLKKLDLSREQHNRFAHKLHRRLLHMERQISDILLFARGSSSGEQQFCLAELLNEFAADMASELQRADVCLHIEIENQMETSLRGRQDALRGVLDNLLDNALRHGADEIRIALHGGRKIRLVLSDNGEGIPDEYRDRIFDPFFTTRTDGTGLGLAVAQNVVLSHQGEITCAVNEKGGAAFTLEFPRANTHESDHTVPFSPQQFDNTLTHQPRSLS